MIKKMKKRKPQASKTPSYMRAIKILTLPEKIAMTSTILIILLAIVGPLLTPYSAVKSNPAQRLQPPSKTHIMGTDENGIDVFSRVLSAPRMDVFIAITATLTSVIIGTPIGLLVGFFEGGKSKFKSFLASLILRLCDIIQSFPVFVFALTLVAISRPSAFNIILAVAFINIPIFVRLVRGEVISLRERPYADSARIVGNSDLRLCFKHLLINALSPVVVQISVVIGFSVLITAGLSFVGAGVQPPTPELGAMISGGSKYMVLGQWWPSFYPGIMLCLTVFSFATTGEALRHLLEPPSAAEADTYEKDEPIRPSLKRKTSIGQNIMVTVDNPISKVTKQEN